MSSLSPRKNVIITGASGLLGGWLVRQAPRGISVIAQTRSRPLPREWHAHGYREQSFDLTAPNTLEYVFRDLEPSAVIHTAARSVPAQCDNDLPGARLENIEVPKRLTQLCADTSIPFIHISTDLVFEGKAAPYTEDGKHGPLGAYAQTKSEAEREVLKYEKSTIIRPPLLLGRSPSTKRSADENLSAAIAKVNPIPLFTDEYRTPIHAGLLATLIWKLFALEQTGVFHLAGKTRVSRLELAQQIAAKLKLSTALFKPGSLKDFKGPYPRAADVSLNCSKAEKILCEEMPTLEQSLNEPLAQA